MAGVLERFPRLRVLLAHGGGALPVLRGRLRRAYAVRPEAAARTGHGPDWSLRRFYYDTVTHDAALLADLVRLRRGRSRCCSARTSRSTWAATTASRRCARSAWAARKS